MYSLGLIQRPENVRAQFAQDRPYVAEADASGLSTVLQPVAWIRNQLSKPSCCGQAVVGRRDSLVGAPPWGSAVDAWTDARRRHGALGNPLSGTYGEAVFESLICRGTSRYKEGEDDRPIEQDMQIDDLAGELEAADARIPETWEHHQIGGSVAPQAIDALARNLVVVFGAGLRSPFFNLSSDEVATSKHIGGDADGHEQGIVGYHAGRVLFIAQNSWGGDFGGLTLPDDVSDEEIAMLYPCAEGRRLPGCFWLEPEVLEQAWDVDVLRVR